MKDSKVKRYAAMCRKNEGYQFNDLNGTTWLTDHYSLFKLEKDQWELVYGPNCVQSFSHTHGIAFFENYNLTVVNDEPELCFKFYIGDDRELQAVYTTVDGQSIVVSAKHSKLLDSSHTLYLGTTVVDTNYIIVADNYKQVQGIILPVFVSHNIENSINELVAAAIKLNRGTFRTRLDTLEHIETQRTWNSYKEDK